MLVHSVCEPVKRNHHNGWLETGEVNLMLKTWILAWCLCWGWTDKAIRVVMAQHVKKIHYKYHLADNDGFCRMEKGMDASCVAQGHHYTDMMEWAWQSRSLLPWSMRPNDDNKHFLLLALWTPTVFPFIVVHVQGKPIVHMSLLPVSSSSVLFGFRLNADSHPSFNFSSSW